MANEQTALAEPTITDVPGGKFQVPPELSGTADILRAASGLMKGTKSSAGDALAKGLKKAEQQSSEQKSEPKQEQKQEVKQEQKAESKSGLPVPDREVKRNFEASADQPRQEGSALESFRQETQKARQAQFKKYNEQQRQTREEEGKTETKSESKTEEKKTETNVTEQPVTMEEIEKELNNPALSKRHQERMRFLATKAKQADTLEAKAKDLETKLGSATSSEEYKKLQDEHENASKELMQFRRKFALESDPDIKKQYDDVISQADEAIMAKLKDVGISEPTLKLITSMGGFDAFSRSNATLFVNSKDADTGEMVQKPISASDMARNWMQNIPFGDAKFIEAKMIERFNTADARRRKVAELSSEAEKFFKDQSESIQRQQQEQAKIQQETVNKYKAWTAEFQTKEEWMKERSLDTLTDEREKQDAQEFNKAAIEARQLLDRSSNIKSVEEMTELVGRLVRTPHLQYQLSRANREIDSLKQQLSTLGSAVKTTKSGAGSFSTTRQSQAPKGVREQMKVSALDAIREDLEKLRGGGQYNADEE